MRFVRLAGLAGLAGLAAACALVAQPCLAAALPGDLAPVHERMGAFAGLSLALPLGTGRRSAPRAALRLSPAYAVIDGRSGALVRAVRGSGLELGVTAGDAPTFMLAGRSRAELKRSLGFKGSTGYIVAGGVVLGVLLLAAVASAQPKPGPRKGDFPSAGVP